ncbi:hypothetical protein [Afipia felis]
MRIFAHGPAKILRSKSGKGQEGPLEAGNAAMTTTAEPEDGYTIAEGCVSSVWLCLIDMRAYEYVGIFDPTSFDAIDCATTLLFKRDKS